MNDPRLPVFAADPSDVAAGDVVLRDALAASGHAPGCACCAPRSPLAAALNRLFLASVRGQTRLGRVLVACAPGAEAALVHAIAADPVSAARFRYAGRLPGAQPGSDVSPEPSARCM